MESHTRSIDGHEYLFTKFGAKQSMKYLGKVLKLVGEPIAMATGAATKDGGKSLFESDMDFEMLGKAIGTLCEKFDDEEVQKLIIDISSFPNVLCDGVKVEFDSHYAGKLDLLFKVVRAALEVQYGNFFGALTDALPVKKVSPTSQPTT